MVNESALKNTLIYLAEDAKTNYTMIASLVNEIAALRETVKGLDPTFSDVLEVKRDESQDRADEKIRASLAAYDSLIQRLKDGLGC